MKTALIFLLFLTCSWAQAQSGKWRYNPQGQLVDGKGQLANAHQEMHDMSNPSLYTTGAVAVSNTIDPNFAQANLTTIEALMDPNTGQGGRSMSRLYLTPSNPYTPGAGVQSGAPVGFNSDHYDKILLDASSSGYKPTQSGAYMAKTHENSSASLFNRGFHTYEANAKFLAAKEAAGGQGGGIVFMINQSGESFAHLQAISGSNMFMSAYGRMQDGSVYRLGGQVVLNQKHNKSADLNTSMFGPAFVAGVHEANQRMASTGNEQGFWVTGTGDQTQIQDWGDGSAHSISAAYNPNARFHVHTHPNNTGPSHADMFASAVLGGMPGMVVAANGGQFAYGFQLEAGILKAHNGMVVFEQTYNGPGGSLDTMNGYDFYGSIDHSGTVGVGTGFGATYGKGIETNVSYVQSTNENGIVTGRAVQTTVLTTAGFNLFSGTPTVTFSPQTTFVDGTVPVASLTVSTPIGTASGTISLDNPGDYSIGLSRPGSFGATIGVGTQTTTNSSFSGGWEGAPSGTTYSDYNSGQW